MKQNIELTGIVLAAGGGSRMGEPKSLLPLDGTTVVSCHVNALSTVCSEVIVVIGADAPAIKSSLTGHKGTIRILENSSWEDTTQIDSLRIALDAIDEQRVVLVTPVDTPPATPETLQCLCAAYPQTTAPVAPTGERGHPVMLSPVATARVRTNVLPRGLRPILADANTVAVSDPLAHLDFDTPDEWREFLSRWTNRL